MPSQGLSNFSSWLEFCIMDSILQEADSGRVRTYPRHLEGVIRQGDTARVEARNRRKEKKQEERAREQSEVQRLKTLKRKEIEAR